jgi:hypothetical protein
MFALREHLRGRSSRAKELLPREQFGSRRTPTAHTVPIPCKGILTDTGNLDSERHGKNAFWPQWKLSRVLRLHIGFALRTLMFRSGSQLSRKAIGSSALPAIANFPNTAFY